jgi:ABC transporter substrate binding protein
MTPPDTDGINPSPLSLRLDRRARPNDKQDGYKNLDEHAPHGMLHLEPVPRRSPPRGWGSRQRSSARHSRRSNAHSDREIEAAFAGLVETQTSALLVGSDVFFNNRIEQVVALAARYAIPTMYAFREFVAAGGLMGYGTSLIENYRQVGLYTGRILKGEKPADLPVQAPIKFELVINLRAARVLGLDVPPTVLARADEVIE